MRIEQDWAEAVVERRTREGWKSEGVGELDAVVRLSRAGYRSAIRGAVRAEVISQRLGERKTARGFGLFVVFGNERADGGS